MENKTELTKPKRKYELKLRAKTHKKNPYMEGNSYGMVASKTKRITNNQGSYMVKADDGEIIANVAGFWTAQEVDTAQFVKLYINGVKAFSDLTTKGTKVFELMYLEMQNEIGKDKIYLNLQTIDQAITKISKTIFYDGLNELIEKKFLAPTEMTHWYWINPDYVFNGDRLSFAKTYIKKNSHQTKDDKTIDMFEPQKIE